MDRFIIQDAYYHVHISTGDIGGERGHTAIEMMRQGMNEARSQGVSFAGIDGRKLANGRKVMKIIQAAALAQGIDAYTGELVANQKR
jgi:hypothetical protein